MFFTKVMLLVFLEASFSYDVQAQGNVFNPGKYKFAGSLKVLPNGNVNLRLSAKKVGAGPSSQPPSFGPTPTTSGLTTGTPSGGTFSTGTGPTTGFSTTPGNRNAGSNGIQVGLDGHNRYRTIHNAPMMRLTQELNSAAQQYASKLARESKFEHDENNQGQGENLGLQCAPGSDADLVKKVVDAWYAEVCDYNFNNQGFSSGTGHFTQVVWKGSTQLGIGFARGTYSFSGKPFDNCLFVVGRYKEPGNMMGAFPQNVIKGSFNRQNFCSKQGNYGKRNKLLAKSNADKNRDKGRVELIL